MNLGIDLCGVALKNPVMTASGTFGSGEEYSEFVDLNKLGAVVTKGVANVPWEGNPTPRVAEVYGGNLHSCDRIDHGECIRTARFRCTRHLRDVGDIRGKLHDDRLLCVLLYFPGDGLNRFRILTKGNTSLFDIRTGDVDFENFDLFFLRQQLDAVNVFLHRETADVGDNRLAEDFPQCGQFVRNHMLHAGILQADGIQHSVRAFRNARRRVAEARLQGRAFERKGSQAVYIIKFVKFSSVAESAARRNHRIIKADSAKLGGNIRFRSACGFLFSIYHMISSLSKTGPSLQILLFPYFVLQEQPMQAPKPHPIRSSKLSCPEVFASASIAFSMASGPQA